jgi:hypothetical protein
MNKGEWKIYGIIMIFVTIYSIIMGSINNDLWLSLAILCTLGILILGAIMFSILENIEK